MLKGALIESDKPLGAYPAHAQEPLFERGLSQRAKKAEKLCFSLSTWPSPPRAALESQFGRLQGIAEENHVTALCASLDDVQPRARASIRWPSPATEAAPFHSTAILPTVLLNERPSRLMDEDLDEMHRLGPRP